MTVHTRFGQNENRGDASLLAFATGQMETGFRSSFPKRFGKHFPTNIPLAATVPHQKTTPKLTRKRPAFRGGLLASSGAGAKLCCQVLRTGVAGQVSCFCALRVRAAPSRLIAPSRPPINRLYIPRRHCLRLLCLGRSLFGLKQGMLLFQFLPSK